MRGEGHSRWLGRNLLVEVVIGLVVYFDISVAEIESMVQSDGVLDDTGRKSVAFISIHALLSDMAS